MPIVNHQKAETIINAEDPNGKNERRRRRVREDLATEAVKGTALALESVDNIERGDSLALGVLGVGDSITDDTLEEGFQDTTGLFVDH